MVRITREVWRIRAAISSTFNRRIASLRDHGTSTFLDPTRTARRSEGCNLGQGYGSEVGAMSIVDNTATAVELRRGMVGSLLGWMIKYFLKFELGIKDPPDMQSWKADRMRESGGAVVELRAEDEPLDDFRELSANRRDSRVQRIRRSGSEAWLCLVGPLATLSEEDLSSCGSWDVSDSLRDEDQVDGQVKLRYGSHSRPKVRR